MPKVLHKYRDEIPPGAVYVGRGSPYGNPYIIGDKGQTREDVIRLFAVNVLPTLDVTALRGKDLICFCAPKACHADLLLKKANE